MKKKLLIYGLLSLLSVFATILIFNQFELAETNAADDAGDDDISVIIVNQVSGEITLDPEDRIWAGVSKIVVSLLPQDITEPKEFSPSISRVTVQAVRNQNEIAIRLEWTDPSKNTISLRHDDFRDAAAVMFPLFPTGEKPPDEVQEILPFMGDEGHAVNIWHWKADWEREGGVETTLKEHQYPNMQSELYKNENPGTNVNPPGSPDQGNDQGVFDPGQHLKNILADESLRNTSVEDLNAIGFGSLTTQGSQDVNGHGIHSNNGWKVVMKRKITNDDGGDTQFDRFGSYVPIAFAVWDGQHGEIGSQKGRTAWHYLKLK